MSIDPKDRAYQLLRKFMNPSIQGPNTEAILRSLAENGAHLITNVEAVHASLYVATAEGKYLDLRLANNNLTRPANVGLSDETFRDLGIAVTNKKQIRDLINSILETVYGPEYTRGHSSSQEFDTYNLDDNDTLRIQFDDGKVHVVEFNTSDFQNISAATAQEVADAITRKLSQKGVGGYAVAKNDGLGNYVAIFSPTIGPSSSVRVLGGKAQNALKFAEIRPTSGDSSTQWSISLGAGGRVRMTWTAGANPSLGKVKINDYVNVFGAGFADENKGTFTVLKVQGGSVGNAYVEFENPFASSQVTLQGSVDGVLFFFPKKITILTQKNYATSFQSETNILEVYLPAITRIVRRERIGSAHVIDNALPLQTEDFGPYIFDQTKGFCISKESTTIAAEVNSSLTNILPVADASGFPDEPGFFCLNFGTALEEGPIPYIGRPSSGEILLNPSYRFKNNHPSGADISYINYNKPYVPELDGSDYQFYLTDTVSGRIYAETLINEVVAAGVNVVIILLFPGDEGLGKWSTESSEIKTIYDE